MGLLLLLQGPGAALFDTDAYYHLAVARATASEGLLPDWPHLGASLLDGGRGDKELLFHLALVPAGAAADPEAGGRITLAILGGIALAVVGWLAAEAVGTWGLLVPLGLLVSSTAFSWRLVRLRPELLALPLVLLALRAAGRRRPVEVGVWCALFALSYTAFHALVGLILLLAVFRWLARGEREAWRIAVAAVGGAAVGLLVHPGFPANLEVWTAQNLHFFLVRGFLAVGSEIRPVTTDVAVWSNLGWLLSVGVLWRSRRAGEAATDDGLADAYGIGAAVFTCLYLGMSRFSLYAVPLSTLWLLHRVAARGEVCGGPVGVGRLRLPFALALGLALGCGGPGLVQEVGRFRARTAPGPDHVRATERQAIGSRIPDGARVAAPWGSTPLYLFEAPGARYLNVLDPVFMWIVDPDRYATWRSVSEGRSADLPLALSDGLDSDHLAFPRLSAPEALRDRLAADPRMEALHRGLHELWRVRPAGNRSFLLDWRIVPSGATLPPAAVEESWMLWPRHLRAPGVEGFVDLLRIGVAEGCAAFAATLSVEATSTRVLELAAWADTNLWVDDRLVLRDPGRRAVLGQGVVVPELFGPGRHRLTVLTCTAEGQGGFYLLDRSGPAAPDRPPG